MSYHYCNRHYQENFQKHQLLLETEYVKLLQRLLINLKQNNL